MSETAAPAPAVADPGPPVLSRNQINLVFGTVLLGILGVLRQRPGRDRGRRARRPYDPRPGPPIAPGRGLPRRLLGVHLRSQALGTPARQDEVEDEIGVPHGVLTSFYDDLVAAGYLARHDGEVRLTVRGQRIVDTLTATWTAWLLEQLAGSLGETDRTDLDLRVRAAVRRITRRVMLEHQRELQAA